MAKAKPVVIDQAATGKKPGTALVNIHEELKKAKEKITEKIGAPSGDLIRTTQDKKFAWPDGTTSDGTLRMVILDFVSIRNYRHTKYREGEESPPACFSVSNSPKGMVPSDNSPDKQHDGGCDTCPNNEWGTDGAGKICKEGRLLAVVRDNDDPNEPIYLMKASATAIKAFDAYVNSISAQFDSVPIAVVTDIYLAPNEKYSSMRFGNPSPNPNLEVHFARREEALKRLLTEPDVSQYKPPAPAKGAAKKR